MRPLPHCDREQRVRADRGKSCREEREQSGEDTLLPGEFLTTEQVIDI